MDDRAHLSFNDVPVDNLRDPKVLEIRIKSSKSDMFRQEVNIFLGRIFTPPCPLTTTLAYLADRGKRSGPSFCFTDGKALSWARFVTKICEAL